MQLETLQQVSRHFADSAKAALKKGVPVPPTIITVLNSEENGEHCVGALHVRVCRSNENPPQVALAMLSEDDPEALIVVQAGTTLEGLGYLAVFAQFAGDNQHCIEMIAPYTHEHDKITFHPEISFDQFVALTSTSLGLPA